MLDPPYKSSFRQARPEDPQGFFSHTTKCFPGVVTRSPVLIINTKRILPDLATTGGCLLFQAVTLFILDSWNGPALHPSFFRVCSFLGMTRAVARHTRSLWQNRDTYNVYHTGCLKPAELAAG
jgi:hypothetical protein